MNMSDPNYEVLLTLLTESKESHKESKEDLKHLRDTTHAIRGEMGNIAGQIQLLSQSAKLEKENSNNSFQRLHERVDAEVLNIEKLTTVVNEIAPKVNRINTIFDLFMKGFVTAIVGGVMYATSLLITK